MKLLIDRRGRVAGPGSKKRGGFTLGEVLVTVAIISVLAAVVIPSIGSQLTKGDLGRVSSDLLSVRGAMEQFVSDLRLYPNSIGQLTTLPVSAVTTAGPLLSNPSGACPSPAVFTAAQEFTAQQVARWRGPYLNKDSLAAIKTGYGASIRTCFGTLTVGTSGVVDGTGTKYVVVLVPGIDQATATVIDAAIDDGVLTTGALRWNTGGTPGTVADTLKLLALPVQP
jgi:prepilin-type N-terminal cleavage/methylation domain-containing protein